MGGVHHKHIFGLRFRFLCFPQALASLCYYCQLATRFLPLVRDAPSWTRLWSDEEKALDAAHPELAASCTLPKGELGSYAASGWCRLEVLAALCPKRTLNGAWRQGPLNTRFRYHHDPNDAGVGPRITADNIRDPLKGRFTMDSDRELIPDLVSHIAARYSEYKGSGSAAWKHTVDMDKLPAWLRDAGRPGAHAFFLKRKPAETDGIISDKVAVTATAYSDDDARL